MTIHFSAGWFHCCAVDSAHLSEILLSWPGSATEFCPVRKVFLRALWALWALYIPLIFPNEFPNQMMGIQCLYLAENFQPPLGWWLEPQTGAQALGYIPTDSVYIHMCIYIYMYCILFLYIYIWLYKLLYIYIIHMYICMFVGYSHGFSVLQLYIN